ncbi:MAG TPA: flavin reductase family protein [Nocardioides sp.]|nr:flavin reductase family protein [Nocardioides sp.]
MTIHDTHPFLEPESERDPARRFRGRLGGSVTLWTAGVGDDRAGLTVSSLMVAGGEPARILGLVDPDSDLADTLRGTGRAVVHLLGWKHRDLADAFAGVAPAPGGAFRMAVFEPGDWGPQLVDAPGWAAVSLESEQPAGWSSLVTAVIDEVHLGEDTAPLVHRRGHYLRPSD